MQDLHLLVLTVTGSTREADADTSGLIILLSIFAFGCTGVETQVGRVDTALTGGAEPVIAGCRSGSAYLGGLGAVYCIDVESLDVESRPVSVPSFLGLITALAMDVDGRLYCTVWGQLYELDVESGTGTPVEQPENLWIWGLAALPDGTLLGAGGQQLDSLYVIDPQTGSGDLVATIADFQGEGDVVLHSDGNIYWTVLERENLDASHLLRVNPNTWEVSYVGPIDVPETHGLMFVNGRLIGTSFSGALFDIDVGTGSTSGVHQLGFQIFDATTAPWW